MRPNIATESQEEINKSVQRYVHSCHVDGGGYFFARISPGSLLDTYYAVKTLSLIGSSSEHPEALRNFVISHLEKGSNSDTHALYLTSEILKELGDAKNLAALAGGFATDKDVRLINRDSLYIEVTSEL